ncbi:MAG: hypothetical protein FJ253_06050, partial [Phycisphaerae bacterium]|nr:hypothetical protein [Phycisphaerae bacterium]
AQALSPQEFGMASVVMVACGFVMVLPMPVMGDLLITHQHHLAVIAPATRRVTIWTTVALVLTLIGTAPLIAAWYDQYPFTPVAVLLCLSAIRPIAEAMAVAPLTRLRLALRYREIAVINGVVQLGSAVLTVVWAVLWPGAAAIVMPQVLAVLAKAIWWGAAARRIGVHGHDARRTRVARRPELARRVQRRIVREFGTAALAQYIHTVLSGLPLIVVSRSCDENTTGQFGFAFTLANQTTMVLSVQLASVLQPIFGRLKTDRARQIGGYMRVVGTMAALAVPAALLQMALAAPLFELFFPAKWAPAIPIFVAFSAGQAFGFILAPAVALLKAQGRYGVYFVWQVLQTLLCLALFPIAVTAWGAEGVAWVDTALWVVTMPTVVWIGTRAARVPMREVLRLFLTPWITAGPIAVAAWLAWREMPGPTVVRAAVAIVVIGPAAMLASLLAIRVLQPAVAREIAPMMSRVLRRVPFAGRALAEWFEGAAPADIMPTPRSGSAPP